MEWAQLSAYFRTLMTHLYKKMVSITSVASLWYGPCYKNILHAFFNKQQATFITNAWLKSTKNQANAEQYTAVKLLLFQNYSRSLSRHHPKIKGTYSKNKQKNKVSVFMRLYD